MIRRPHRITVRLNHAERDNLTELQGLYGHQDESYIVRMALADLLTKRRLQMKPSPPAPPGPSPARIGSRPNKRPKAFKVSR